MRSHGDPNQTDPTTDAHWGINITIPLSAPASLSNEVHGGTAPDATQYLAAASAPAARRPAPPRPAAALQQRDWGHVRGVHAYTTTGYPNYPDPTGNRTNLIGIDA